jgi:Na+/H+ antiporter NhaC
MDWGVWSLLPPVVSLVVAMRTRQVVLALVLGCLSGLWPLAMVEATAGGVTVGTVGLGLVQGGVDLVRKGVYAQVAKDGNAHILVLIFMIGGFVGILESSGITHAFAQKIVGWVRTQRSAQLATWAGGLAIFFSDVGNSLILGPLFRPVYDRMGVSREKLAYIVDSTAAPVCVLVPFIGWGVYITGLLEEGSAGLSPELAAMMADSAGPLWDAEQGHLAGFQTLVALLPFQLYPLLTLATVPLVIWAGREFGPMRRTVPHVPEAEVIGRQHRGAGAVVLALGLLLGTLAAMLIGFSIRDGVLKGASIRESIAVAYLVATLGCAWVLARSGISTPDASFSAFKAGMGRMMPMAIIIIFAWTLGDLCKEMGTGPWLSGLLVGGLPPAMLPVGVFLAGAAMSFATGTSFGTFAILVPIALPLAAELGSPLLVTLAAVLSGGIFGDHTSPISDTTVLASMGAGSDHADHVATQLPYALIPGSAAAVSFGVAGVTGHPAVLLFGVGLCAAAVLVMRLSIPPSAEPSAG